MHIAITGSTGILGSILIHKLKANPAVTLHSFTGDISIQSEVDHWISSVEIDYLFHFAALVPVDLVNADPFKAYQVNVGGTMNLLSSLKKYTKKPWVFYASSSHVYKSSDQPITENNAIEPINIYGQTKHLGEVLCENFVKSYSSPICIGRIFSFYHERQKKPFLYPSILERLKNEDLSKPFQLQGGKNIRDLSNAEEIVDSILELMKRRAEGIINIGSGKGFTIEEFVQKISPVKLNIVSVPSPTNALVANISRLNSIIHES